MNEQLRSVLTTGLFFASLLVFSGASAAVELNASSPLVKGCEACHGTRGDSQKAEVPRLNGQKSDYILIRLKEFRDPSRKPAHASPMPRNAAALSDSDSLALAQYFSRQTPSPSSGFAFQTDAGAQIFLHGAEPATPACAICHGPNGDGLGGTPRIAGQHRAYLMQQLADFNSAGRIGVAMNRHTWDMTLQQMQELSEYLANN